MISTIFEYFVLYSPYIHHKTAMASETSAIALRSEEIRKEMPVATASGGGEANLSHDIFFILLYFIKKMCM